MVRDLTIDDFKDKLGVEGSTRLDILAIVAEKAKEISKDHKDKLQEYAADEEERRETCDGEAKSSSSKRGKCKPYSENNPPPPPLPEKFKKFIREMARGKVLTPPTLVIQKFLFQSDAEKNHDRFNIPISQSVRDDFLTDDEKRLLQTYFDEDIHKKKKNKKRKKERRKKMYLEVKMIEPSLELETVQLRRRDMEKPNGGKASCNYVINGNSWFDIVSRNYLTEEMEVQLWCFRLDQELHFALALLP